MAKRSRLMRSASVGEAEVVALPPDLRCQRRLTPVRPAATRRSPVGHSSSSNQARPAMFSISSPVETVPVVCAESDERNCKFFERCYYCNQKICLDGEVFMYSDLQAFCRAECRERQMDMEGTVENTQASKRAKDQFSS